MNSLSFESHWIMGLKITTLIKLSTMKLNGTKYVERMFTVSLYMYIKLQRQFLGIQQ